jgi:uncharacterized protein (TIGR00369 family)
VSTGRAGLTTSLDQTIGVEELTPGQLRLPVTPKVMNHSGSVHGGAVAALAEAAARSIAGARLGRPVWAADMNINYLGPGLSGCLTASAHLLWATDDDVRASVTVADHAGKQVAAAWVKVQALPWRADASVNTVTFDPDEFLPEGETLDHALYDQKTRLTYRHTLGITSNELGRGRGVIRLTFCEQEGASLGLMASLVDSSGGMSLLGNAPPNTATTVNLQVQHFRLATGSELTAYGRLVRSGRSVGVVSSVIIDRLGVVAAGSATFLMTKRSSDG